MDDVSDEGVQRHWSTYLLYGQALPPLDDTITLYLLSLGMSSTNSQVKLMQEHDVSPGWALCDMALWCRGRPAALLLQDLHQLSSSPQAATRSVCNKGPPEG